MNARPVKITPCPPLAEALETFRGTPYAISVHGHDRAIAYDARPDGVIIRLRWIDDERILDFTIEILSFDDLPPPGLDLAIAWINHHLDMGWMYYEPYNGVVYFCCQSPVMGKTGNARAFQLIVTYLIYIHHKLRLTIDRHLTGELPLEDAADGLDSCLLSDEL